VVEACLVLYLFLSFNIFQHRSPRVKNKKNFNRLHELVNELSDRDQQLKKDMKLFEEFFDTFPVPVTMWSITKEHVVVSQRGNGFISPGAKNLCDLFDCPNVKNESLENHEKALAGDVVSYFVKTDHSVHYVKLVPRTNEAKQIIGVSGIAWDVTVNAIMLSCLEDIHSMTLKRRGDYKNINSISKRALSVSRLKQLLEIPE